MSNVYGANRAVAEGTGDEERAGEPDGLDVQLGAYREELLRHCYRMLGSLHDAEDAVQEVLTKAWRSRDGFEGLSSVRTWLHRIVTTTCLDLLEGRRRRWLPGDVGPTGGAGTEIAWLEPFPDSSTERALRESDPVERYERRESMELAFVAALQHLPPRQRAALVLRDVLAFTARDAASALGVSIPAVNSATQHARSRMEQRIGGRAAPETTVAGLDPAVRAVGQAYVDALESGDVDQVLRLLADEATYSMPPEPSWYRGKDEIEEFLRSGPFRERWQHRPIQANAQPAVACYRWDEQRKAFEADVIDVLEVRDGQICSVTAFLDADLFAAFGLPARLAPGASGAEK